ncbi:MAG: hypothetical protein PHQ11_06515 [Paludibacter sp.]|nr:hypothetical protein [Paludibacter sp.]
MSDSHLSKVMAEDMGIINYISELGDDSNNYILYSGVGEWIKTSTSDINYLDTPDEGEEIKARASKHHITLKCQKILKLYLDIYPNAVDWFYPSSNGGSKKNPIVEIRNRLVKSGHLVSSIENTYQYPPLKCTKIMLNLYLYRGYIGKMPDHVIGLGSYVNGNNGIPEVDIMDMYRLPIEYADRYVEIYLKEIKNSFNKCDFLPPTRKYFNPYSPGPIYKSWVDTYNPNVKVTVYSDSNVDYGLIKEEDGAYYTTAFPSEMIKQHEVRRFIYGLWALYRNQARAQIHKSGSMFTVKLPSFLPSRELNIMYMLAWPKRNIMDQIEFIAPLSILPIVENTLEHLCMKMVIVND